MKCDIPFTKYLATFPTRIEDIEYPTNSNAWENAQCNK